MLLRQPTQDEIKTIQRKTAQSIRTDWERYDQRFFVIVRSPEGGVSKGINVAVSEMKFDEDKNPICGAVCCIAGRAAVIGVAMGLVARPVMGEEEWTWDHALSMTNYDGIGDQNSVVGQHAWILLGLPQDTDGKFPDIFDQHFHCLGRDEGDVEDSRYHRRLNAYRVARMIDEIADGRKDATDRDVRCRPIELPPETN